MARNESTRKLKQFPVRRLVKTLLATGTASLAVLACVQSMSWVFATLRTRMLAAVALASMSAMVAAQAPSGGAPSQPIVNAQIAKTADAFTRAMLAGDARAIAATFTVDGYELPPHHPAVKGRAAIQQRYEAFFKGPVKMTAFAISPDHVDQGLKTSCSAEPILMVRRRVAPSRTTRPRWCHSSFETPLRGQDEV